MNVIKQNELTNSNYNGLIPLVSGEIAEDFTEFFAKSEQKPTALALGVLVNKDGVKRAGGYIINPMPDATDEEISKIDGPVYLRLSRLATPQIYSGNQKFEFGKSIQIGEGTDASIISTGVTVSEAIKAQEILKQKGIDVRVIDVHTIKPIDKDMIIKCAKETKQIITVEDHSIIGGLGSSVCEVLSENYPVKVKRLGINDQFGKSGRAEELMDYFKINADAIVDSINK